MDGGVVRTKEMLFQNSSQILQCVELVGKGNKHIVQAGRAIRILNLPHSLWDSSIG